MFNVKPYEKNAKKHPPEQIELIAKSIARFGWQQPIKIGADGVIIVGHGRWAAWSEWSTKLGLKEPWIVDAEGKTISGEAETRILTEDEERAYRLADNQINALSGNDHSLLLPELKELNFASPELFDLTGFDRKLILEDDAKSESVPGLPTEPRTKVGDVYQIGPHRVICGDSTVSSIYDNLFALDGFSVGKADMVLTDPPYNVDYTGKTKDALKIENDHKSDDDFAKFLTDAFTNVDRVLKTGGVFYIWHADSEGYNFRGACQRAGWRVRQCLIWNKNVMVMGRQDYHWKHEPCLYGWKEGASHLWNADRTQTTVLDFARPAKSEHHPTMKPVALLEYQIGNNTKGEDIVFDPFLGSGSTLIAAEKIGRICYGIELDPKYCDVIIQRYVDFTGSTEVIKNGIPELWKLNGDLTE